MCKVRYLVQTVQKTVVFLQVQLSDGFLRVSRAGFRALDDEEVLRHSRAPWVALTLGVLLPGVRPPVDATISG